MPPVKTAVPDQAAPVYDAYLGWLAARGVGNKTFDSGARCFLARFPDPQAWAAQPLAVRLAGTRPHLQPLLNFLMLHGHLRPGYDYLLDRKLAVILREAAASPLGADLARFLAGAEALGYSARARTGMASQIAVRMLIQAGRALGELTDAALALAMMHVIIGEGLYDADYVARHTLGFDELREKVKAYPPERAAQWTGIAAEDIRKLAREYATVRPSVIRVNYGVQRSEGGGMATRAIAMLPCIIGSLKEVGGGIHLSTSGAFELNKDALRRPDLRPVGCERPARIVNMVRLGEALNTLNNPPLQALFVYNSNPAAVCPNHNEVVRGLKRPDLFTVVHEQFLTDTTDYADIVLPATTFFEHKDLQAAYGHYYLQVSDQAIEPLGECRANVEVFRALAERMGFTDPCFAESVDQMIDGALDSKSPLLEGISRERLERERQVRLNFSCPLPVASGQSEATHRADGHHSHAPFLPFANGNFRTPSGKAELYSEAMKALGLDPVAEFTPPVESRHGGQGKAFPLEFLARKADNFMNSTFANQPSIQEMEELNLLEMHSADARVRGIANGDTVRVYNRRGEIRLKARVDGAVQPGVVSAKLNWAKLGPEFRNVNVLTSEKLSDLGNSATFYSVLVEVESSKSFP